MAKKNKKEKKSSSGIGGGLIALLLLALLGGVGFGIGKDGFGENNGDNTNNSQTEDTKDTEDKKDTEEKDDSENMTTVYVTVSGSDYYYQNEKIELEDLILELEKIEGDIVVELKDEDAAYNTYSQLKDKLEELSIAYQEK